MGKFLALFVPAGNPAYRTVEGIQAAASGRVTDKEGKTLFRIKGKPEQLRASIFGVFSTKAGQEYLDRKVGSQRETIGEFVWRKVSGKKRKK